MSRIGLSKRELDNAIPIGPKPKAVVPGSVAEEPVGDALIKALGTGGPSKKVNKKTKKAKKKK